MKRSTGGLRLLSRWLLAITIAAVGCAACAGAARVPADEAGPASPLAGVSEVASGLDVPWGIAFLPDGSALVAERNSGRVLQVPVGGGAPAEVVRLPIRALGEGGLLGLAVSPTFGTDQLVYAYHTAAEDNRIIRFRLDTPAVQQVVLTGIDNGRFHNGGRIAFGPDGMLYVGTGDAGDSDAAQDPTDLNGKILRITPDGRPAPDNPDPRSPIYSLGHRNVQGLTFDAAGRLYAIEFGQNSTDEVNVIEPGRNYGWPEVEGRGDSVGGPYTDPLVTWTVAEASPSGAAVAGSTLWVAALRGERLWSVPLDGRGGAGSPESFLRGTYGRIRTVVVAPDGALWISTSNRDGRGDVRDGDDRILRVVPPA